jgi:hypothetical protein
MAFFMQLYLSKPLWEAVAILQDVQFPGRFNTVFTLAMVALVVLWTGSKDMSFGRSNPAMWIIVALLVLLGSVPVLKTYSQYRLWSTAPTLESLIAGVNEVQANTQGETSAEYDRDAVLLEATNISRYNFFLPRWSNPDFFADTHEAVRALMDITATPDKVFLVGGTGSVRVQRWQPPHIELAVNAETALQVGLLQLYYPGWLARLDDGSTRLEVSPSRPDGLLVVEVPAGTHRILIGRESLPEERAGQVISGVSLAGLAGFALWLRLRRPLN